MKTLAPKVDGTIFRCSRDIESQILGKKLQNISKEIIKHEEIYELERVHMSQFHSRIERISPSVTETFGVVRKCASIYEPRVKNVMQFPRTEIKDAIKRTMFYDFFSCCRSLISRCHKLHAHKFSPHNDRRPQRHNRCDFFNFSHYKCDKVPASLHAWMLTSLKMNLWRYERK